MFVEFKKINGEVAFIERKYVSAVSKRDGYTCIYILGDVTPFEVKETVEEAIDKLSFLDGINE